MPKSFFSKSYTPSSTGFPSAVATLTREKVSSRVSNREMLFLIVFIMKFVPLSHLDAHLHPVCSHIIQIADLLRYRKISE